MSQPVLSLSAEGTNQPAHITVTPCDFAPPVKLDFLDSDDANSTDSGIVENISLR